MNGFDQIELLEIAPPNPIQLVISAGSYLDDTCITGKTLSDSKLEELFIEGNLHFKDCEFIGKIEISKTLANSTIFENCVFHKSLTIKELESNIIIIGCIFHHNVLFHWDPMVDGASVDTVDTRFLSNLTFNGCNQAKINLHNTKASDVIVDEQSDDTTVKIVKSELNSLSILNSAIKEIDIKISTISKSLTLNIAKSIMLEDSEIGKIISDDPEFWSFLKDKKLIGPLFKRRENGNHLESETVLWSRVSESLIVFIHSFQEDHRYDEADTVFYLMRFARIKEQLSKKNLFSKLGAISKAVFYGYMGGWGVKLLNPILTSIAIILLYTGIYSIGGEHTNPSTSLQESLYNSINLSIGRFFNIGESLYNIVYLRFMEGQEGIIGLIFITLIIGMFIRKLVR
ncbi:hypothetical protein V7112_11670 [Bacillus sp. JJ1566]|uniref:hypothetical protein n=1 Tax=Bacillus sp. JJ1566 TaxID=3122961 RepID=UPI002FFE02C2